VYVQCVAGSTGAAAAGVAGAVARGDAGAADADLPPPCSRKYEAVPVPMTVQQARAMIALVRQRLAWWTRLACWRS
jgi:hypothetical protein